MHLLDRKYHKFSKRSKGLKVTTLSLCHFATIGPRGVRVEANLDNVTNYTIFFEGFSKFLSSRDNAKVIVTLGNSSHG